MINLIKHKIQQIKENRRVRNNCYDCIKLLEENFSVVDMGFGKFHILCARVSMSVFFHAKHKLIKIELLEKDSFGDLQWEPYSCSLDLDSLQKKLKYLKII